MPRIRTIKPEFWDSPGTAKASLRARLFYIAMWNWADDYGVGTANAKALIGFAFPNDDEMTAADFPSLSTEVADCFGVVFYEVDGRPYYAIPTFDKHQRNERKAKSRNPAPPKRLSDVGSSVESDGNSVQEDGSSGTGTGEPGNRGTGEPGNSLSELRPDVDRLCEHLADRIEANGSKRPNIGKGWRDAARLMIDNDGRAEQQIHAAIDWCQGDEFWRSNILSMPKLREKYDQLRLASQRARTVPVSRQQQETNDLFDRAAERMGVAR